MKTTLLLLIMLISFETVSCSIVYYVDPQTGKIYVANNEDYWYDTKAFIRIIPERMGSYARLWYGWDDFAQGGINEHGLFLDGAVTPDQYLSAAFNPPKTNLGDEILSNCKSVDEALRLLDSRGIGLTGAHMMIGDANGSAVIVEWVNNKRVIVEMSSHFLVTTNFLHSDPNQGNYPCHRFDDIQQRIALLSKSEQAPELRDIGNLIGGAVQVPRKTESGKVGGTLYSSFIDISDMKLIMVPKLSKEQVLRFDLKTEFAKGKKQKIKLF
ncbi:MAG: penicillin acylase [Cyclobacteriaceae bacterium]